MRCISPFDNGSSHMGTIRTNRQQLHSFFTTRIYSGVLDNPRGESLHLADALSRAHLEEFLTNAEQLDINLVEHVISDQQLAKFVEATKEDEILSELQLHSNSGTTEINYR